MCSWFFLPGNTVRWQMAVLDFLRRRHPQSLMPNKSNHGNEIYYTNDVPKAPVNKEEKWPPTHAVTLAMLAQAGAYIPFQRFYDLFFTLFITALSAVVRMYRIDYPPQVV
jgi:hypothetical protein